DEFEDSDFGGVAAARSELDDAGVAARAIGEAGPEGVEQLRDHRLVDDAYGLTAIVNAVGARDRDQAFDLRTELLRLRQRGDDAFPVDQRSELVAEERVAMRARASQLAVDHSVSH